MPFGIAPVQKHIRLGHVGVMDHSVDLQYQYLILKGKDWKK